MLNGGPVIIVGGGLIGVSIAFHLAERGYAPVTVLERDAVGQGSTPYATGGIRHQYSSRVNVELTRRSMPLWDDFAARTGGDLGFRRHGYAFAIADPDAAATFRRSAALQRSLGVEVEVLEDEAIGGLFPGMRTDDLRLVTHTPQDGSASAQGALDGLLGAARRGGVEVAEGETFTGLVTGADGAVTGVTTARDRRDAELVVLACGPQAAEVGARCGVRLPVVPRSRQAFALAPEPHVDPALPLVVDLTSGAYLHPGGAGTAIVGGGDRRGTEADRPDVDWSRTPALERALLHRFPTLAGMRLDRGWAGLRDMTADDHPIVGPVAALPGLWTAVGFSGHGFMHAPAVGEALAQRWLDGRSALDIGPLHLARFDTVSTDLEQAVF